MRNKLISALSSKCKEKLYYLFQAKLLHLEMILIVVLWCFLDDPQTFFSFSALHAGISASKLLKALIHEKILLQRDCYFFCPWIFFLFFLIFVTFCGKFINFISLHSTVHQKTCYTQVMSHYYFPKVCPLKVSLSQTFDLAQGRGLNFHKIYYQLEFFVSPHLFCCFSAAPKLPDSALTFLLLPRASLQHIFRYRTVISLDKPFIHHICVFCFLDCLQLLMLT